MTTRPVLVRPAAVAGAFYPADPDRLVAAVRRAFEGAVPPPDGHPVPKALVVPHAGYAYSGPVAASAYLRLGPARHAIRRLVVLGPSHYVPLSGVAVSAMDAFATPLGPVPVDAAGRQEALGAGPFVRVDDRPHAPEHSLEVELPFLQLVLDRFELVPLAVGRAGAGEVAAALEAVWGGPETLVVVSTDLSHHLPHDEARAVDRRTAAAIAALAPDRVGDRDACGAAALRGLLLAARAHHLTAEVVDVRTSGDTTGDRQRVVGYAAVALT